MQNLQDLRRGRIEGLQPDSFWDGTPFPLPATDTIEKDFPQQQ
jgi:hypothetical protein